jgi:hypothetical protein
MQNPPIGLQSLRRCTRLFDSKAKISLCTSCLYLISLHVRALYPVPLQLPQRRGDQPCYLKGLSTVLLCEHVEKRVLECGKAIVLIIVVKVALIAVQSKQPMYPHLARLCMHVKVLQSLQTKRVVGPAVLRD